MNFIIQKNKSGNLQFDFQFALIEALNYRIWCGNNDTWIDYNETTNFLPLNIAKEQIKDYVPVGSVEFVTNWLKQVYNINYVPIQIPDCLLSKKYMNRWYQKALNINAIKENILSKHEELFIKDISKLKTGITGIVNKNNIDFHINFTDSNKNSIYFVSETVDFKSEYRIFVYKNEIVGIKHYLGDFFIYPDSDAIKEMVEEYSKNNSPIAYTLDVGIHFVDNNLVTSLIEVHDFFSCGLYGFDDKDKLPFMFYRWFKEYTEK